MLRLVPSVVVSLGTSARRRRALLRTSSLGIVVLTLSGCGGLISLSEAEHQAKPATIYAVEVPARADAFCGASAISYYRKMPGGRAHELPAHHVYFADPGQYALAIYCPGQYEGECLEVIYFDGRPEAKVEVLAGNEYIATCTDDGKPLLRPANELVSPELIARPREARPYVPPDPGPLRPFPAIPR